MWACCCNEACQRDCPLPIGKHSVQGEEKLHELQCELAHLTMRSGGSESSVQNKLQQILVLEHCQAILLEDFTPIEMWLKKAKAANEKAMAKLPMLDNGEEELDW